MHIGILQCGPTPPEIAVKHGKYPRMFAALFAGRGWRFSDWNVEEMAFPESPAQADVWLLTGSRHGVYEDHAFIPPLEDFIRAAAAQSVPMLGICFGHQIIAQALGGRVEKAQAGWGLGRHVYDMDGLGEIGLTAWHQDQVLTPPEGARTIARSAFCPHAALVYEDKGILTLQPHPEFSTGIALDFVALRKGDPALPADRMQAAEESYATPLDVPPVVTLMAEFLERAHARRKEAA